MSDETKTIPPTDWGAQELASGAPVTPDHREIDPATGQQKGYIVLTKAERDKGFVRPVRRTYVHVGLDPVMDGIVLVKRGRVTDGKIACGTRTTMGEAIAETYAREPKFYSGTFCVGCGAHYPLAQFVWEGTTEMVGS